MTQSRPASTLPWPAEQAVFWLPEDTEESIMGTILHQEVIRALATGLDVALTPTPLGAVPVVGASGVGGQTRIEGFRRRQGDPHAGTPVALYPDVFVYGHPIDPLRATYVLAQDGPPLLIVEVYSPSTGAGDLDEERGKVWSYGAAGVREYLVFDAVGEQMAERVRGWRWDAQGRRRRWRAGAEGRWHSGVLGVSFAVEGLFLQVYDGRGQRIIAPREVPALLATRDAEITTRDAEIAARDAEIATRDAEIAARDAEIAALRAQLEQRR